MRLGEYFDRFPRHVVSIIGCGGKTSLMWHLAKNRRKQKTLVTTTTHTQLPDKLEGIFSYFLPSDPLPVQRRVPTAVQLNGICLAGTMMHNANSLSSLPPDILEHMIQIFLHHKTN